MCHRKPQISANVQAAQMPREESGGGSWISGLLFAKLFQPPLEGGKCYKFPDKNNL